MQLRLLVLIAGLVALSACGEPLGKREMLAGCEAAAAAVSVEVRGVPIDYRAVVGREAIVRFELDRDDADPEPVTVKCKVNHRGQLRRIKIDAVRMGGARFDAARTAFAAVIGR